MSDAPEASAAPMTAERHATDLRRYATEIAGGAVALPYPDELLGIADCLDALRPALDAMTEQRNQLSADGASGQFSPAETIKLAREEIDTQRAQLVHALAENARLREDTERLDWLEINAQTFYEWLGDPANEDKNPAFD